MTKLNVRQLTTDGPTALFHIPGCLNTFVTEGHACSGRNKFHIIAKETLLRNLTIGYIQIAPQFKQQGQEIDTECAKTIMAQEVLKDNHGALTSKVILHYGLNSQILQAIEDSITFGLCEESTKNLPCDGEYADMTPAQKCDYTYYNKFYSLLQKDKLDLSITVLDKVASRELWHNIK